VRAVDQVLAELSVQTDLPYSWLVGEPCFGPPIELVNAFERAAGTPSYAYPPQDGLPRLREVLAAYQREEGQAPEPDQIVITSGAKGGLMALFAALLEPGDELIHPTPCYPSYPAMAARLGALPVAVAERGASFAGWPEAVADHIGPKTRAVVLASPSNPTGATLDAPQATALVELCRNRGIRLICDEAYFDFNIASDREVAAAFDPERKTVVQIRSASKSWALCGWRVGWVAADAALVASVARSHAALINPASGPAQKALCSLPEVPGSFLNDARATVQRRISDLCWALESVGLSPHQPEGGFYLWLNVSNQIEAAGSSTSAEWCTEVARRRGVGLWPGEDFGVSNYVRIAVTAPSDKDWPGSLEALAGVFKGDSRDC
jgi:aspartate aminotransferase